MRLNVACGSDVQPGMVNVDLRPTGQVVADVARLPFRTGTFESVRALDILEHDIHPGRMLDEWHRVLGSGGQLTVKVPNLTAIARALLEKPHQAEAFIRNIYGGHRWGPDGAWDTHHWGWTPATIHRDLDEHGFDEASNDHGLNMTVEAVRR